VTFKHDFAFKKVFHPNQYSILCSVVISAPFRVGVTLMGRMLSLISTFFTPALKVDFQKPDFPDYPGPKG
jgi:hypothetical protein